MNNEEYEMARWGETDTHNITTGAYVPITVSLETLQTELETATAYLRFAKANNHNKQAVESAELAVSVLMEVIKRRTEPQHLVVSDMFRVNVERARRWHNAGTVEWTPLEWAGAMCGEAGEAANAAKKLKRLQGSIATKNAPGRHFDNYDEACDAVAREVADTIIYGLLLLDAVNCIDPEKVLRDVFNAKSIEYNFPERW
jgi:NTP pyrophosphatase (non-canonical NTP hydrolase)